MSVRSEPCGCAKLNQRTMRTFPVSNPLARRAGPRSALRQMPRLLRLAGLPNQRALFAPAPAFPRSRGPDMPPPVGTGRASREVNRAFQASKRALVRNANPPARGTAIDIHRRRNSFVNNSCAFHKKRISLLKERIAYQDSIRGSSDHKHITILGSREQTSPGIATSWIQRSTLQGHGIGDMP